MKISSSGQSVNIWSEGEDEAQEGMRRKRKTPWMQKEGERERKKDMEKEKSGRVEKKTNRRKGNREIDKRSSGGKTK